jgi:hypothetical protein
MALRSVTVLEVRELFQNPFRDVASISLCFFDLAPTQHAGHNALTGSPRRLRRGEFPGEQNLTNRMIGKAFLAKPRAFGVKGAWCRRSRPLRRSILASVSIPFCNLNQRRILCNAKNGPFVVPYGRGRANTGLHTKTVGFAPSERIRTKAPRSMYISSVNESC